MDAELSERNGSGYGSGSGYGDGSGDGSGDGYGDGSGSGSGYGSGVVHEPYWVAAAESAIRIGCYRPGAIFAVWRSRADGTPANGGSAQPVKVGDIQTSPGPLDLCKPGTLHATWQPEKWKGCRWWAVAMYPPYIIGDNKIGSLKREIIAEIKGR